MRINNFNKLQVKDLTRDRTKWTYGGTEAGATVNARARRAYDETNRYRDGHLPHREDYSISMSYEEDAAEPALAADGCSTVTTVEELEAVGLSVGELEAMGYTVADLEAGLTICLVDAAERWPSVEGFSYQSSEGRGFVRRGQLGA